MSKTFFEIEVEANRYTDKEILIITKLVKLPVEKLVDLWEETEKHFISVELAETRGWIMSALSLKNPTAYDKWMSAEYTTPENDMPRNYFLQLAGASI